MDKNVNDIFRKSYDDKHVANLIFVFEIRHGPPYYHLKVDDISFGSRIFGINALWSSDSRYCAFQEWLTIDYNEGPRTRLLVVDILKRCEFIGEIAEKGFVEPVQFKNGILRYNLEFYPAIQKERNLVINTITDWKSL